MSSDRSADKMRTVSRRRFTALGAGALATGVAGCAGGESEETDDQNVAVASFFSFYDFTRRIAEGTPMAVENLVPVGLHGHGWEPDPTITQDIVDADVFVHVGPDFQPWADRAIQTVQDDDADTHLINAREGIDLLPLADTVEDDEEIEDGLDPHFWLDPALAKQASQILRMGSQKLRPRTKVISPITPMNFAPSLMTSTRSGKRYSNRQSASTFSWQRTTPLSISPSDTV